MNIHFQKYSLLAVILGVTVVYAVFIFRSGFYVSDTLHFVLFDDAMISMRYAENFGNGDGLVWNPGGERVEGYTNLLWTLLMSLVHFLPLSKELLSLPVMAACGGFLLLFLLNIEKLMRNLEESILIMRLICIFLIGTLYPIVFWSLQGMEVALMLWLMSVVILRLMSFLNNPTNLGAVIIGVLLGLIQMTRMDGLLFNFVVLGFLFFGLWKSSMKLRYGSIVGGVMLLFFFGSLLFRYFYYGDLLPNTYYLKMTGFPLLPRIERGATVLLTYSFTYLSLFLFALVCVMVTFRKLHLFQFLLLSISSIYFLYSVYIGGDAWEYFGFANRFLTLGLPFLIVFVVSTVFRFVTSIATHERILGFVGLCFVLLMVKDNFFHWNTWLGSNYQYYEYSIQDVEFAYAIRNHTPETAKLAVVWAGTIPYFSERETIDLLGKNDFYIARTKAQGDKFYPGHMKWDLDYSIGALKPDLVVQEWGFELERYGYYERNGIWISNEFSEWKE